VQSNKQNAFESNPDFLKANTQIGNQMQVTVEVSYSVTNHMLWNWFPNLFLKHHIYFKKYPRRLETLILLYLAGCRLFEFGFFCGPLITDGGSGGKHGCGCLSLPCLRLPS
jgi:hypothetical protein